MQVSNFNQPIIKQEHIKPILKDLYNANYLTNRCSYHLALWFITNGGVIY